MSQDHSQRLEPLATEVVDKLQAVAGIAQARLSSARPLGMVVLANMGNTLNSDRAPRKLIEQAAGKAVSGRDSEDTVNAFGAALSP